MTYLILLVIGVLAYVAALFFIHRLGETLFTKWHHAHLGFVFVLIPWWPVQLLGIAIVAEDAYQHWRQKKEPTYLSPLHRAYVWVYRKVAGLS